MEKLSAILVKEMFNSAVKQLERFRKILNQLNVYPVPDGDTGNNMLSTLKEPVGRVFHLTRIREILKNIAKEALFCARGNSGIILAQFLWGFAKACPSDDYVTPVMLEKMFKKGTELAYTSLTSPQEGTILTVMREVSEYLTQISQRERNMLKIFKNLYHQAQKAVKKTKEMLPVLKEAGVVDAGGQGFAYILRGFYIALRKRHAIKIYPLFLERIWEKSQKRVVSSVQKVWNVIKAPFSKIRKKAESMFLKRFPSYRYCVEMIIKGRVDEKKVTQELRDLGDSFIVVKRDNILHIHIHTNHPFKIEERTRKYGDVLKKKIDDIHIQHKEFIGIVNDLEDTTGIVAVVEGDGFEKIFTSLGVDGVVKGKGAKNPSVEEILAQLEKIKKRRVFVLPNNPNVILTAENAATLSPKEVKVIPTKTIPEGISAVLSFSPEDSFEENEKKMRWAIKMVNTGEVAISTRDTKGEVEVKRGDIIGMVNKKIKVKDITPEEVLLKLLEKMVSSESRLISVFYGNNVGKEKAEEVKKKIKEKFLQCEVELYYGGTPHYFYILSVE